MFDTFDRLETFTSHNGDKASLPFSEAEYDRRLASLRQIMAVQDIGAVVLTSMHNVAYYSGFLYCAFGRPYACVVTADACTTILVELGKPMICPTRANHCPDSGSNSPPPGRSNNTGSGHLKSYLPQGRVVNAT